MLFHTSVGSVLENPAGNEVSSGITSGRKRRGLQAQRGAGVRAELKLHLKMQEGESKEEEDAHGIRKVQCRKGRQAPGKLWGSLR